MAPRKDIFQMCWERPESHPLTLGMNVAPLDICWTTLLRAIPAVEVTQGWEKSMQGP
jgi:hypothetical protein